MTIKTLVSDLPAGSKVMENGLLFKELLQTPNFRITVVDDADTVELCGALKVSPVVSARPEGGHSCQASASTGRLPALGVDSAAPVPVLEG